MSNDTYAMQVAQMRQQRRQQELAADYNQAVYGREESLRNRQEIERQAATIADPNERAQLTDDWHYYDAEVQRCEADMRRLNPPQQQMDPRTVRFIQERKPFVERYGYAGAQQAWGLAHNHLTRPGAAKWDVNSPEYFKAVDELVEMYGPQYGYRFDPSSDVQLTPNEAAEISGLSPRQYNQASQELAKQKRFTEKW